MTVFPMQYVCPSDRQRNGATPTHLQNFAVGSPLWSLYKALGRAYRYCILSV